MSTERKTLKIMSIIYLVLGILDVAFSIFCLATGTIEVGTSVVSIASATEVILLISGIVYFLTGVTGIRGANNPAKAGPVVIMAVICILIALFNFAIEFTQASGISGLATQVVIVLYNASVFFYANKVKKEGQERLS